MRIGIVGTGHVGQALAEGWSKAGHEITLGSRQPDQAKESSFKVASHEETVRSAEVVVNATPGGSSVDTLTAVGPDAFAGKVLIDIANAVTDSGELVYPNASLAAALQDALPQARVVKTLNTMNTSVQVNPSAIGPSSVFVSGNDAAAKATVRQLLGDLGWADDAIIDLGDVTTARGPEHYFPMFGVLVPVLKTATFNVDVVH